MKIVAGVWLALLSATALGCGAPARWEFRVDLRARTDDGTRLPGVQVFHGETLLGQTGRSGELQIDVEAAEGNTFPVRFACPDGFDAAEEQTSIPLRRVQAVDSDHPAGHLSVDLECRPRARRAAVAVFTDLSGLPISIDGIEVGATNEFGAAHVALDLAPGALFEVAFDTSSREQIVPRSPVRPLVMPDRDEVFVVQQWFFELAREPAKPIERRRRRRANPPAPKPDPRPVHPRKITGGKPWGKVDHNGERAGDAAAGTAE